MRDFPLARHIKFRFLPHMKELPFWRDNFPFETQTTNTLPPHCDIAVIGGGLTGLATALHLARCGAAVVLLGQEKIGRGESMRNAGMARSRQHDSKSRALSVVFVAAKIVAETPKVKLRLVVCDASLAPAKQRNAFHLKTSMYLSLSIHTSCAKYACELRDSIFFTHKTT